MRFFDKRNMLGGYSIVGEAHPHRRSGPAFASKLPPAARPGLGRRSFNRKAR